MTSAPLNLAQTNCPADLAIWLAHELRNPLAPITAAAQLLVSQPSAEQVRQLAAVIERNAAQLRSRIDELVHASSGKLPSWPLGFDLEVTWPGSSSHDGSDQQLVLPLDGAQTPASQDVPAANESAGLRVLVVDDNRDAGRLLGLFVQSLGHQVQVLSDPLQALEAARRFEPQLALLDIGLPGMDGHELARRLQQLPCGAEMRLAAVTAYNRSQDRQAAARAGFEQYFVKPLDVSALQAWLALVCEQIPA